MFSGLSSMVSQESAKETPPAVNVLWYHSSCERGLYIPQSNNIFNHSEKKKKKT